MELSSFNKQQSLAATTVILLCLLSFISLLLSLIRRRKTSANKLPPGPRGLPLLGNLPFLKPELHRYFGELAETYGPVMGLWLGSKFCVVLSSPSTVREALKDKDSIFANHDPPTVALISSQGGHDMLWCPMGPEWRIIRKSTVRELMNPSVIEGIYPLRRREIRRGIAEIHLNAGKEVELREVVFNVALNVVTSMLWGKEADATAKREFREVIDGIVELLGLPNVSDFFPALAPFDLQGLSRRMRRLSGQFDQIFESIVEERRSVKAEAIRTKDFLDVMMELVERGDPQTPLTMKHVNALFLDLVAAATDTTSTTVEWAMSELLANPEKLEKAQKELDTAVGKSRVVEESDIHKFQYLDAVMREALRLHPVIPLLVPHCPSSSTTITGYTIPKGTRVFINVWAIQRDPSVWPDNPMEFRPERFLGISGNFNYNGSNFSYLPFGSGRRVCVGISLAEKMIIYKLASLLHSFDWQLPAGKDFNLKEKFGIVMNKEDPLVAVPVPRLKDPKLYH